MSYALPCNRITLITLLSFGQYHGMSRTLSIVLKPAWQILSSWLEITGWATVFLTFSLTISTTMLTTLLLRFYPPLSQQHLFNNIIKTLVFSNWWFNHLTQLLKSCRHKVALYLHLTGSATIPRADVQGVHWTVVIINLVDHKAFFGDSLASGQLLHWSVANMLWNTFSTIFSILDVTERLTCHKQPDGFNCGVYVINILLNHLSPRYYKLTPSEQSKANECRQELFCLLVDNIWQICPLSSMK